MYPYEMKQYIDSRNGELSGEEANYIIDVHLHPQLTRITYNVWNNSYEMWDKEGNYFYFTIK